MYYSMIYKFCKNFRILELERFRFKVRANLSINSLALIYYIYMDLNISGSEFLS